MESALVHPGQTIVGFANAEPLPPREFLEPQPTLPFVRRISTPRALRTIVLLAALFGGFPLLGSENVWAALTGLCILGAAAAALLGPALVTFQRRSAAKSQFKTGMQQWEAARQSWWQMEQQRVSHTRRWFEIPFPRKGLLTVHGDRMDSHASLVQLLLAQWIWDGEDTVIIDAGVGVGPGVVAFASEVCKAHGGQVLLRDTVDLLSSTDSNGVSSCFDPATREGRENRLSTGSRGSVWG